MKITDKVTSIIKSVSNVGMGSGLDVAPEKNRKVEIELMPSQLPL